MRRFTTPKMIWVWSANGLGEMSRKLHQGRAISMRDGHKPRAVILNNWEATSFDLTSTGVVDLYDPAKHWVWNCFCR